MVKNLAKMNKISIRSKSYLAKEGMTGLDIHSLVKLFFKSLILSNNIVLIKINDASSFPIHL